jgi:hypothetical protein
MRLPLSGDPTMTTKILGTIIEDNAPEFQKLIPLLSQVRSHICGENASQSYATMSKSVCLLSLIILLTNRY